MEKEEIRLRCIEVASRQTVDFLDTMARADKFYNYVLSSTADKPIPSQVAQTPRSEPRKTADNVKHLT